MPKVKDIVLTKIYLYADGNIRATQICQACEGDGKVLKISASPCVDFLPPEGRIRSTTCSECKGTGGTEWDLLAWRIDLQTKTGRKFRLESNEKLKPLRFTSGPRRSKKNIRAEVNEKYKDRRPCPIHGDPCRCTP